MTILVTGGAGYIGAMLCKTLHRVGMDTITVDNLSTGRREAAKYGKFVDGDIGNPQLLDNIFRSNRIDGVAHLAASSIVSESLKAPEDYYRNNVINTKVLLDAMARNGVGRLVFSSTASIYGVAGQSRISEKNSIAPMNPYGESKWRAEQIISDYCEAHGQSAVILRYFNAAGADPESELGEAHEPETHLIPLVMQVAAGRRDYLEIFGCDFETADGTAIRDYVHVLDVCQAHIHALTNLSWNNGVGRFNIGAGTGYSVREIVSAAEKITDKRVPTKCCYRRRGDPACLVADIAKAATELAWQPARSGLHEIIGDAWRWQKVLDLKG